MKGTKSPSQRWLICDDSRSVSPSRCYILASPRGHAHNDHNKAPFGRKPVTTDITGELSDCSPQSIVPVSLQAQTAGQLRASGIGTSVGDQDSTVDLAPWHCRLAQPDPVPCDAGLMAGALTVT